MCSLDNTKNRCILVIDDNDSIHEDFRMVLRGGSANNNDLDESKAVLFGDSDISEESNEEIFEVDSAIQGKAGLEKVQKALDQGKPYAMAFVDMRMPPGWDGVETVKHIWAVQPDLQVVICTAYSDYSWDDIIAELGQADSLLILKKPFDNAEVRQLAHSLIEKWNLKDNLAQMNNQEG